MIAKTSGPKVFLAHSHPDKQAVRDIYSLLKVDGFVPWFDEESLVPGHDWEHEIKKAVRESDAVAIFLSPQAVDRAGYLHKELTLALDTAQQQPEGAIFLIPMRFANCDTPERVRHLHWLDLGPLGIPAATSYLRLQHALLRRSVQLGLLPPDAAIRRESWFKMMFAWRALGRLLNGTYLIRGQNPNGTRYYGTADLVVAEDGCRLAAIIGGHRLEYMGSCNSHTSELEFSGPHTVRYRLTDEIGVLSGEWDTGGVEELLIASPFAHTAPS